MAAIQCTALQPTIGARPRRPPQGIDKPKRQRVPFLDSLGEVVRHARETRLRFADCFFRTYPNGQRAFLSLARPGLLRV